MKRYFLLLFLLPCGCGHKPSARDLTSENYGLCWQAGWNEASLDIGQQMVAALKTNGGFSDIRFKFGDEAIKTSVTMPWLK